MLSAKKEGRKLRGRMTPPDASSAGVKEFELGGDDKDVLGYSITRNCLDAIGRKKDLSLH